MMFSLLPSDIGRPAAQGYPEVASLLLSNGANPGAMTLRHLTPLHLACHQGHLKVARLLLEAWAPVDDRDEAATSPLHLAAQKGHIDVVRLLLQCGADKDALDESGWTPVFFASWKGHAAATRMLLQAGANARVIKVSVGWHTTKALTYQNECKSLLESTTAIFTTFLSIKSFSAPLCECSPALF